jgi:hypothetical protein
MMGTRTPYYSLFVPSTNDPGATWGPEVSNNFMLIDAALPDPNYVVPGTRYLSLNAAIIAIGSTPTKLVISTSLPFTGAMTVTVPATLGIEVTVSGSIVQAGTGNLVINGPFHADSQAFSGFSAGQIYFTNQEVHTEWFAKGDARYRYDGATTAGSIYKR